jgi:hypothetical protein
MSKKEVDESKIRFVPAKKEQPKRAKTTFLDGVKVSSESKISLPVEIHYKERGKITDDINGSFAMRRSHPGGLTEYFIKQATAGAGTGRVLNPWGLYYSAGDEHKFEKEMGRKRYQFKKVNKEIFDMYIKFLETRNERHLLNVERNILDAS